MQERACVTREQTMSYEGPERRIHRVFVTRNTEYHVRQDRCVAEDQAQRRSCEQEGQGPAEVRHPHRA